MQRDGGHCGERRGNIPRDESRSAEIFDSFQNRKRRKDKKFTMRMLRRCSAKKLASTVGKTLPVDANQAETQLRDFMKLLLLPVVVVKAEQVHEIADRWTIQRNVGVVRVRYRIVEIVAAAVG